MDTSILPDNIAKRKRLRVRSADGNEIVEWRTIADPRLFQRENESNRTFCGESAVTSPSYSPIFPPSNYISNYESSVLLSGRSLTRQVPVTNERTLLHRGSFLFLLFMWHARESIRLSRNGAEHTCVHTVRLDSTANKNVSWREQREPINRKHNDFAKPLCFITSRHDILELRSALQSLL